MSISVDGGPWKRSDSFPFTHRSHYRKMSPHFPTTRRLINFWKGERERQRWWDGERWHPFTRLFAGIVLGMRVCVVRVSSGCSEVADPDPGLWRGNLSDGSRLSKVAQTVFFLVSAMNYTACKRYFFILYVILMPSRRDSHCVSLSPFIHCIWHWAIHVAFKCDHSEHL